MKSTRSTNLCWPWNYPQKWAKNIQKESKTSVFDSFLTESVISVNVDVCVAQNSYTAFLYLRDTCLVAQDKFKLYLDYFKVKYWFLTATQDVGWLSDIKNRKMQKRAEELSSARFLFFRHRSGGQYLPVARESRRQQPPQKLSRTVVCPFDQAIVAVCAISFVRSGIQEMW